MISFHCSTCTRQLAVADELAGVQHECPHCHQLTPVPAAMDAVDAATAFSAAGSQEHGVPMDNVPFRQDPAIEVTQSFVFDDTAAPAALPPEPPVTRLSVGPTDDVGRLGAYRLVRILGEGGMGTVYLAVHTKLDKVVALKTLPANRLQEPAAVTRFEREMKAVGRLDDPHIVQAMDAGQIDGTHFLVMEYVDGLNLGELVRETGPLAVADACELVCQAATGLQSAHDHGMIHRDVKPSNLMLARSSRKRGAPLVKILDLGLARLGELHAPDNGEHVSVATSQMVGSLDYMAPEQAGDSHNVDARSDVYSLGATLYTLLAGLAPFAGQEHDTVLTKLMALATIPPRPLRELCPDLPEPLIRIVERMLAKAPDQRFSSAAEVADALAPFCAGADLQALLDQVGDGPRATASAAPSVIRHVSVAQSMPSKPATPSRRLVGRAVAFSVAAVFLLGITIWLMTRPNDDSASSSDRDPHVSDAARQTDGTSRVDGDPAADANGQTGWHNWPMHAPSPAIAPFDAQQAAQYQQSWADYLGVPVEYTNSLGLKFRLIPPGEYLRGAPQAENEALLRSIRSSPGWVRLIHSSAPQHETILTRPFYLAVYEVTQRDFDRIMGSNPSVHSPQGAKHEVFRGQETGMLPVESVLWSEAIDCCIKLTAMEQLLPSYKNLEGAVEILEGTGYRLPSEAEWEFACRAGTLTRYWIGDTDADLLRAGWFLENSEEAPHPVGELPANPFGLHDVHGNVTEWCQDRWEENEYRQFADHPAVDPGSTDSTAPPHLKRGGHFANYASNCRSAFRETTMQFERDHATGFRLLLPIGAVRKVLKPQFER